MKSLTKNIYTLTVLVAMLLLSCSREFNIKLYN